MPRPWRVRYCDAKYHVTSRGNGRARIFLCDDDYERFLLQLASALAADQVILHAYCLMPNHYHLQVQTPHANLPRFMQRLNTAYSMYFRYKKNRPGHCLQGRYSAKVVEGDEYLLRLGRYIHLNPIRTRKVNRLDGERQRELLRGYRWSSYPSYVGLREPEDMVDYTWLELMQRKTERGNRNAYARYVESFIGQDDELLSEAERASRYAIGDDKFRETTEDALKEVRLRRADHGDIVWPRRKTMDINEIIKVVSDVFAVEETQITGRSREASLAKSVVLEMCCRYSGLSQREVSRMFGYRSESSVGKQRKRFCEKMDSDADFQRKAKKAIRCLRKTT